MNSVVYEWLVEQVSPEQILCNGTGMLANGALFVCNWNYLLLKTQTLSVRSIHLRQLTVFCKLNLNQK
jgi:hypothetical protein